jgi:hypothetical protein
LPFFFLFSTPAAIFRLCFYYCVGIILFYHPSQAVFLLVVSTWDESHFTTLNIHTASNFPNNVQVQSPRVFRFRSPHNNAMSSSYARILRSNACMPQPKVGGTSPIKPLQPTPPVYVHDPSRSPYKAHHHICTTSLQEVFTAPTSSLGHCSPVIWNGAEDLETGVQVFFQVHYGSNIAAAVAVVGCRPHCDHVFVFEVVLFTVSLIIS